MIKKLFFLIIFIYFTTILKVNSGTYSMYGEGELQMSDTAVNSFIRYIRGEKGKSPNDFYITTDGSSAFYWWCSYGQGNCAPGEYKEDIKVCEREYPGKICKKFALKRVIKWKNGINPGKGKKSKINSKWSDAEIKQKLTELGFYKN